MDQSAFEAELSKAGYTEIETKMIEPRPVNSAHSHEYGIKGLVLDGIFIVTEANKPTRYLAGDVFTVAQGQSHTEEIGPQGARLVVGRKY
jgi:quercetin dioxygenase-like cupin family protein